MLASNRTTVLLIAAAVQSFSCSSHTDDDSADHAREEALAPLLPPVCSNLLVNPGFESTTTGWSIFGSATTVTGVAHSGVRAAKVDGRGAVLNQRIKVFGGQNYLLRQQLRGQYGGEIARVQVNWYDSLGNFLGVNWLKPQLTTSYQEFRLVATAPLLAGC